MRLQIIIGLCLICLLCTSGCATGELRALSLREEKKYSEASGGYINSTSTRRDGDQLFLLSRAAWLSSKAEKLDVPTTYVLDEGRMGSHRYRISTGKSADEIILWYQHNQDSIQEALSAADVVVEQIIEWLGFPDELTFDIHMVLGAREFPFIYEVTSIVDAGRIGIAVTDSPFYNYAHDLAPGMFSKVIHEMAHLRYAIEANRAVNSSLAPESEKNPITERINEESAAEILESCTQFLFYREYSKMDIPVPDLVLGREVPWLLEFFPGIDEGKFSPDFERLIRTEPLNHSWERVAYAVMILLSEDGVLDVRSESSERKFINYCQAISKRVPNYLSGQMWPVEH